ncbi:MAG: hypothetical protein EU544_00980 [Promethearchaeota archaeon]|nr:MAG: hypothetical protein EU544_00980 [Candidatus Lokiarchaeota archaeon]
MTTSDIKSDIIEKLKQRFKSLLGEELTDQEILEKCINFLNKHLDELLVESQSNEPEKKEASHSIFDLMTGILEEEYQKIISSGKAIKEAIRESWKF